MSPKPMKPMDGLGEGILVEEEVEWSVCYGVFVFIFIGLWGCKGVYFIGYKV